MVLMVEEHDEFSCRKNKAGEECQWKGKLFISLVLSSLLYNYVVKYASKPITDRRAC